MPDVYLYSTRFCPFCIQAKRLLTSKGVSYRDIPVDGKPELRAEMVALSGRHTVPQIWIDGNPIGGCDELYALERSGQLDLMLALNKTDTTQKN